MKKSRNWSGFIETYVQSDLTAKEFCAENDLPLPQFNKECEKRSVKIRRVGRPLKNPEIIAFLDDETIYSPASIIDRCLQNGLLTFPAGDRNQRIRHRHRLIRLAAANKFPKFGDGILYISGQAPMHGYFGWRWKKAAGIEPGIGTTEEDAENNVG